MIALRVSSQIIRNWSQCHCCKLAQKNPIHRNNSVIASSFIQGTLSKRNASTDHSFSEEEAEQHARRGEEQEKKIRRYKKIFSTILFSSTLAGIIYSRRKKREELNENFEGCSRLPTDDLFQGGHAELFRLRKDPCSEDFCILPAQLLKDGTMRNIKSFKVQPDDVFVAGFPRTGMTWVQEIVYLINNDLNFEKASENVLETRFPYLEYPYPGLKSLSKQTSGRLIKTHLPFQLLPDDVLSSKVIYVTRNPKDVVVSYFFFSRMLKFSSFRGAFSDFVIKFQKDQLPYCPFFGHVNSYMKHEDNPNLLVVSYEDLSKDPTEVIKKIARFLDKPLTESEVELLVLHTNFKSMSTNPAVNCEHWNDLGLRNQNEAHFLRNGKVGNWRNYFNESMNEDFELWTGEKTKFKFEYAI